jgi:DNA polymerase-1
MRGVLHAAWQSGIPLLFHNHRFDVQVAAKWFGLPRPKVVHDTLILLYLLYPHERTLGLKEVARRLLDMPPEERDLVKEWILANVRCKPSEWGAYISLAPVALVGPYANGDVIRTQRLFTEYYPKLDAQMLVAYNRELRLAPILDRAEARGIRTNVEQLYKDTETYTNVLAQADLRICRTLDRNINVDSNEELASALDACGAADPSLWLRTPGGKRSVSKESIKNAVVLHSMRQLLQYRGAVNTCLSTFMRPWLALATMAGGRLHTSWHQVRGDENGGTRTGRMSSSHPNFQNVPNEFDFEPPEGAPPVPLMRRYLLPEEGHVWVKRDFSSQEIRILAHFEDGELAAAYCANPNLDPHQWAKEIIFNLSRLDLKRKTVKITGFSIIYGSGVQGLSSNLAVPYTEAAQIKGAYLDAIPGIGTLSDDLRNRSRAGIPIRTWGGRLYLAEPARYVNGVYREYGYKLLNYLIQGSASDQTKECVINWHEQRGSAEALLAIVHDEINISVPEEYWRIAMRQLREVMDQDLFDVPMRSEGFVGPNWCDLERVENENTNT